MYCLKDQKWIKKAKAGDKCPVCGEALKDTCTPDERTTLVQGLHRQSSKWAERSDNAMSFLVIGAIFLVIGAIFFKLSFKLDLTNPSDSNRYLRFDSLEFVVTAISLGGGGVAFFYGLIKAITDFRHVRVLRHDIAYINEKLRLDPGPTPLWIKEATQHLRAVLKNKKAIRRAEKEAKAARNDAPKA